MTLLPIFAAIVVAVVLLDELIERGHLDWLVELLDAPLRPDDRSER